MGDAMYAPPGQPAGGAGSTASPRSPAAHGCDQRLLPAAFDQADAAGAGVARRSHLVRQPALDFTSGVFFVNLLLAAARCKTSLEAHTRWCLGRAHLLYHALLVALAGYAGAAMSPLAAFLFGLGYAPILVRACRG
jgi:hypothetical protein